MATRGHEGRAGAITAGVCQGVLIGLAVSALVIPCQAYLAHSHAERTPVVRAVPLASLVGVPLAPLTPALPASHAPSSSPAGRYAAEFGKVVPSLAARELAEGIARAQDNARNAFVLVDKKAARVYVFDARARLLADSPALIGAARGDDAVPGIGLRPVAEVRPEERTTPAGRFVAELGRNADGEDVVWVDYDNAISMHRVRSTDPREHRLARLDAPGTRGKRISYGCINLPAGFYDAHVRPLFAAQPAIVYVLPEVKSVQQVFPQLVQRDGLATLPGRPRHAAIVPL